MKKGTPKLTFVIIPDANRSVVRFRLPVWLIVAAFAFTALTSAAAAGLYYSNAKSSLLALGLEKQLQQEISRYENLVSSKDHTIEHLQQEVIALSNQTDEIKFKMDELLRLERELKAITGDEPGSNLIVAAAPVFPQTMALGFSEYDAAALGGEMIHVSDEDISRLVSATKFELVHLDTDIQAMIESLSESKESILELQEKLRRTPTLWPTDSLRVTSSFGYRRDPITGKPSNHSGIDIGAKTNDPVYATAAGSVSFTGYDIINGNYIVIDHGQGLQTRYLHLNKIGVKKGETVDKGSTIGAVGSTGRSTGPHLHYEVLVNGSRVDPRPYMKTTREEIR